MGDLFKAITSSLGRFIYAWILPSALATGVFVVVLLPPSRREFFLSFGGAAVFTISVFGISIIFAYAGRPLYQLLEGYSLPKFVARPMRRRQQKRFLRLKAVQQWGFPHDRAMANETLKTYPDSVDDIMPTRLGNALKGLESYGHSRYGLDSQTFWYELQAVSSDRVRQSTEETRSAVDFFLSSVAHLGALLLAALVSVMVGASRPSALLVAGVCALLIPLAYFQAVRNVIEWRYAVQALVNTSRPALARSLAMSLPPTYEEEARMWRALSSFVHVGVSPKGAGLNDYRLSSPASSSATDSTAPN